MGALTALANPSGSGGSSPGTVPGGSQNTNPLGSSVFSTLAATSPTVATLPGGGQTVPGSAGAYPALNITPGTGLMGTSTTTSAAGGFNPGGGVTDPNAATTAAGDHTMLGDFQATYGRGTGTALGNLVSGLGTSTSQALGIMDTATVDAAQKEYGNLQAQMAASGVDPNSSAAALMSSDFASQLTGTLSSNAAQLGLSEEQMQLQALTGEGQAHGSDVSGWDKFGSVMQGLGNAAVGIAGSMAGTEAGAGALTSLLHIG